MRLANRYQPKNKREPQGEPGWPRDKPAAAARFERPERSDKAERPERIERIERKDQPERPAFPKKERIERAADVGMSTFRIEVGHAHGVKPGNIVGAIANEAGLDSKYIGRIEIFDDYSVLDLPDGMPKELLEHLKTVWVAGQQLHISQASGISPAVGRSASRKVPLSAPKTGGDRRVDEKNSVRRRRSKRKPRLAIALSMLESASRIAKGRSARDCAARIMMPCKLIWLNH